METSIILIFGLSVAVILILWIVLGVLYLRGLKEDISLKWEDLDELLRKRQNLIPNLVETVRYNNSSYSKLLEELVEARHKTSREYKNGAEKIEYEYDFLIKLEETLSLEKDVPELSGDTNFLELKTEFGYLKKEIKIRTEAFNDSVRKYNKNKRFLLIRPLAKIFRYERADIFKTA